MLLASIPRNLRLLGPVASFGIVAFAVFLGLGHSKLKSQREELAFSGRLFAAHLLCVASVFAASLASVRHSGLEAVPLSAHLVLSAVLVLAVALLALACVPLRTWARTLRETGPVWLFASMAGLAACALRYPFQSFWNASSASQGGLLQVLTFHSVHSVLRLFLPGVVVDPGTFVIGTSGFSVVVAQQCSGLEGLGLVLVFTIVWLAYFRKEVRFPQALLLIPCALACVWVLNILRICAIVLIGNAGAPDIAMVGFHSQAGWIAFTAVALVFSMATRNLSWVQGAPAYAGTGSAGPPGNSLSRGDEEARESPATAAFLVPFLAILAASFVSKAASGYFEWLYPLRFVAAAAALWYFRAEYKKLDWRFGWYAPVTGAAVFLLWIAPEFGATEHAISPLGAALAGLAPAARTIWIVFRVAAAAITVPVAEELAFRGYLARRLMSRNFDTVRFSSLTFLSIALSSVAFGVMHGQHWMIGICAGAAFAAVLKRRGRIGDAIVAHAVSNLLLAAWVLLRGDWPQW